MVPVDSCNYGWVGTDEQGETSDLVECNCCCVLHFMVVVITSRSRAWVRYVGIQTGALCNIWGSQPVERDLQRAEAFKIDHRN
jgi:hypothetical protein